MYRKGAQEERSHWLRQKPTVLSSGDKGRGTRSRGAKASEGLRRQNGVEMRVGINEGRDGERRNMTEDELSVDDYKPGSRQGEGSRDQRKLVRPVLTRICNIAKGSKEPHVQSNAFGRGLVMPGSKAVEGLIYEA
ncbi:uncharacterized protein STEHIDRAFT_116279 [Stereum hirsutum FP-91666 SS1]|uniref:Uncharacterized protein n=1 Tax=Stereum hirsutum (strain FP-91666) TaxID=721885 RepID=R7RWU7_STEHR|nr:uncharacterized protein STEHIDRAFT_116279 [Stereum hirsutum FP-91666 SS1]EIM79799.1 hypothetical protein STEHIDRAFT_116279 [Stereum hirsutum FP-91666 SS1]